MSAVPPFLESKVLKEAGFRHAFTTRAVGNAQERDRAVKEHVGAKQLWQATQVHGDSVARVPETFTPSFSDETKADALIAVQPGDAVGIRVADCVPILLAAPNGHVAAVHAGWRGVVNAILGKTIALMTANEAPSFIAVVGPHIGPCCFEVGPEVAAQLGFVARQAGDKSFIDLRKAVHAQLRAAHVGTIDDVGECTKCHPETYHSYRRDAEASGRMIGVIAVK